MESENRLMLERLKKLNEIKEKGINPYPHKFEKEHNAADIKKDYEHLSKEEKTSDKARVAGRMVSLRRMGRATFCHILDGSGKLQLYMNEDVIGKEKYGFLKKIDVGDFIGAKGSIFKTKTGEVTINVNDYQLLAKSLRQLPEKFHGLKDVEQRSRQRYVDLIVNPDTKRIFLMRSKIIQEIRKYLDAKGFVEVETPVLQPIYGGASAKPFRTHHNALNMPLYLRISPELYLKRLIVGGFERVYEIGKNFRNEGIDHHHNPEFTMLEWYMAYADYYDLMNMLEDMIKTIAMNVLGTLDIKFRDRDICLGKKWERISLVNALKKYADIDVEKMSDDEVKDMVHTYNLEYHGDLTRGGVLMVMFEELVEDKLIQPTFVTDYPVEVCPLAKSSRKNPGVTERFELFINGQEWANAYTELNEPLEQRERMLKQQELRLVDEEAHPMDDDYILALEYGMPPTAGLGVGIDRLAMLMAGQDCIRDVIFFPTMKFEEKN